MSKVGKVVRGSRGEHQKDEGIRGQGDHGLRVLRGEGIKG